MDGCITLSTEASCYQASVAGFLKVAYPPVNSRGSVECLAPRADAFLLDQATPIYQSGTTRPACTGLRKSCLHNNQGQRSRDKGTCAAVFGGAFLLWKELIYKTEA